ncbi:MAG: NUDIX hydrolase [Eubacterium sp.]|jgi:ADP-ribose pyrophosphatase|nr:NUDIX hydrolase [Eubacterium sp.]
MHLYEETIDSKLKFDGRVFKAYLDIVRLEDNSETVREFVEHSGGVGILPITPDGDVLLVKQYRYGGKAVTLEVPAGKLELNEDPEKGAIRELAEETGYMPSELHYFGAIFPSPAYCSEIIHIYIADKIKFLPGNPGQKLDKEEFLDIVKIPFKKAVEMVMQGEIWDAKTQILILKANLMLGQHLITNA